jgi:hypothetical protein
MTNNSQREDRFPNALGVAEIPFPVFAASWGSRKIMINIRLVQGSLLPGPACLCDPDGQTRSVTLHGTTPCDGSQPPFDPREMDLLLEGVTILDMSAGQIIIQGGP